MLHFHQSLPTGSSVKPLFFLGRFQRLTTSGRFIPEIDGLRFMAISAVVLYHLQGYIREKGDSFFGDPSLGPIVWLLEHGEYGVQLFFSISGFILGLPFASHFLRGTKGVSLNAYFLRRLTRLEPPYVISMILFFLFLVIYVGKSSAVLLPHLGASLLYAHTIIFGKGSDINGVAWSLEVEIQFYLLVPILARLFAIREKRARRTIMLALISVTIFLQSLIITPVVFRLERSILNNLQYFLIGFLLADIYLVEWNSQPTVSRRWDLVSLFGWPLLPWLWKNPDFTRWIFPPLVFLLYYSAFRGHCSRRIFTNPWIVTIGGMCYTIYLLHYQVISFIGRHTLRVRLTDNFNTEFIFQFCLIMPFLLIICGVFYAFVERPCMNPAWPKRVGMGIRELLMKLFY